MLINEKILFATGLTRDFACKELKLNEVLGEWNHVCLTNGANYALFGGTAINKVYLGNSRFSEDLDLHLFNASLKQATGLVKQLSGVKPGKSRRLFKAFHRFPLHYSVEEEGVEDDVINLDLSLSLKEPGSKIVLCKTRSFLNSYGLPVASLSIPTYELETLVAMKLLALTSRSEGKDFYDLTGLLQLDFKPTKVFEELRVYNNSLFNFTRLDEHFFDRVLHHVDNASANELKRFDAFILSPHKPDWRVLKARLTHLIKTKLANRYS
ncbi:hypothetical protein COX85_00685 [Candidatus Micrarchaeota archaeon CG_4_10_14_0_2_um_filter_55_9]|nr:MAG: hypothetical protein AUJ15_01050 [Candidatus Micrarchaeota archaeon CG1_02_55_41]PIO02695.1 MAG: hypothetical protein COT57_02695 [Candidatus Micrarchaeota archaeon CG09_land_8_20_14_0_10_55_25]PIZ92043.1 MAG: hypothetical protein COX85_00685 [Candidatus Micrarchaeota archaeon CG_4_10_14_0_2_um_filter_55_9]PJD00943.1 MAG: hypothetical protein COU38_03660 [Candidatus Micrarchaeota archaeon CG10_big_fil_rev_8_21_14_0_10_54_18]